MSSIHGEQVAYLVIFCLLSYFASYFKWMLQLPPSKICFDHSDKNARVFHFEKSLLKLAMRINLLTSN
jgi:hypothetical protein